jgi:hypothetical protein
MKNEILEEVWRVKDEMAKKYDFNIDKMVKGLRKSEKEHKERTVDLSKKAKKAA